MKEKETLFMVKSKPILMAAIDDEELEEELDDGGLQEKEESPHPDETDYPSTDSPLEEGDENS